MQAGSCYLNGSAVEIFLHMSLFNRLFRHMPLLILQRSPAHHIRNKSVVKFFLLDGALHLLKNLYRSKVC